MSSGSSGHGQARCPKPSPCCGLGWSLRGFSYWTDDGITWTRETSYDDETILNQPQAVGDFLMTSNQMLAGTVKNVRAESPDAGV